MNPALRVRNPGLLTTVQDLGRFGHRRFGVPQSGALDRDALLLANALVGNGADQAALECIGLGPTLTIEDSAVRMAVLGAQSSITGVDGQRRAVPPGHSMLLQAGDTLAVGPLSAFSAIIAVEHGIDVEPVLGSRSTYLRGGFGGLGRKLEAGDRLPIKGAVGDRAERRLPTPVASDPSQAIRVVLGPQDNAFTAGGIETFLSETWRVTNSADRMGFRLEGARIDHENSPDIVSDGAVPGAIQVPGSGQPIVLLADGQSVGGYTKIATVISCDLSRFARHRPGEIVRFAAVTQARAEALAREHDEALRLAIEAMEPVREGLNLAALYRENLVSGVTPG